jgi:hypothetical protein
VILSSEFLFAPWREKSVESAILDPSKDGGLSHSYTL